MDAAKSRLECSRCGHLAAQHGTEVGCRWAECGCTRLLVPLSTREFEVLRLLAFGEGVKGTAEKLNLSVKTVEVHMYNMKKKTGINRTMDMVLASLRCGLLMVSELPDCGGPIRVLRNNVVTQQLTLPGLEHDRQSSPRTRGTLNVSQIVTACS
jgi:DNA-binding CsgD family transcriptional regulator